MTSAPRARIIRARAAGPCALVIAASPGIADGADAGLLDRGVFLACSQFEANFVSAAHGEVELQATLDAARGAFFEIGSET